MLRMLGRLMWIAVGAVGVKAWEESQRLKNGGHASSGGGGNSGGKRKRSGTS